MMISNVRGEFRKLSGTIVYDSENPSNSGIDAEIEAASINTRGPQRDGHLKEHRLPGCREITVYHLPRQRDQRARYGMESEGRLDDSRRDAAAILDVDGPTPETKDPWANLCLVPSITTKIDRKDFPLTWSSTLEAGGVLVGDEVKISIDL
jgi:polyisoprenoid-binding protein YceI